MNLKEKIKDGANNVALYIVRDIETPTNVSKLAGAVVGMGLASIVAESLLFGYRSIYDPSNSTINNIPLDLHLARYAMLLSGAYVGKITFGKKIYKRIKEEIEKGVGKRIDDLDKYYREYWSDYKI